MSEPITIDQLLGRILRNYREAIELSQDDIAGAVDIPRPSVTRCESGERPVKTRELLLWARRLGRPPAEFIRELEQAGIAAGVHELAPSSSSSQLELELPGGAP